MTTVRFRLVTFSAVFLGLVLSFILYLYCLPVVSEKTGKIYYLRPATSKKVFIEELTQQGIIPSAGLFSLYIYPQANAHLKTGEYFFPKGSTQASIWKQVTHGTGLYYRPFAIIPGWSFVQLREALTKTEGLHHLVVHLDDKQLMLHLGYNNLTPEGNFFPETYYYTKGISDLIILKHAVDLMQHKLNTAWQNRAPGLPYKTVYEALIVASLVEKEAYLNSERPVIAGVIINRLRKDMLLQIDPTVIYGLGPRYNGKIHKADLTEDTVYNTYVHKGLPPTPIAMPSMASIEAAMHPEEHEFLYFVAKGDGSHQFSKTLPEHHAAVSAAIKMSTP